MRKSALTVVDPSTARSWKAIDSFIVVILFECYRESATLGVALLLLLLVGVKGFR